MWAPLEDYALIADGHGAALVSRTGSIDWACLPRFDHAAMMSALLGDERHGMWLIAPLNGPRTTSRRYRDGTMVLETEVAADDGRVRLVDAMPWGGDDCRIVRTIEGLEGSVELHTQLVLSFDYGTLRPLVRRHDGRLVARAGPDAVVVDSDIPLDQHRQSTVGNVVVEEGQRLAMVLTHFASHLPIPDAIDAHGAVARTTTRWRQWIDRLDYGGDHAEVVRRSMLVIRALTYEPSGGLVTAPTAALPERLGGPRNWDYRYCWMRDSAFAVYALMQGGYHAEARRWREWILRASCGSAANLQPVFGPLGERRLHELEATWLPGYEESIPVQIGNTAGSQFQLDVFGEVVDALYRCEQLGLEPSDDAWQLQQDVASYVEELWTRPGSGIWELRGPPRQYTHSKVMAWVAVDRVVRMVEEGRREVGRDTLDGWRDLRDKIKQEVLSLGFDDDVGAFVQHYGSKTLDASLLLLPQVGFLPADDQRVVATVDAIEKELMEDGWLWRYDTASVDDGLPEGEGAFLCCMCWLADVYVLQGRDDEARELFERVLSIANDVGLLSEEYDPRTRRQVGNFPLALTHLAVANTARNLSGEGPAHHRGLASGI